MTLDTYLDYLMAATITVMCVAFALGSLVGVYVLSLSLFAEAGCR